MYNARCTWGEGGVYWLSILNVSAINGVSNRRTYCLEFSERGGGRGGWRIKMLSVLIDWLPGLGWLKKESVIRVLYPVFQQYLVYLEEEMKMKSNNQVRINLPFYLSTCLPGVLSEICLGGGSASVRAWKPSKIHRFLWSRGMSPHSPPLLSTYLPIYQSTYLPIYLSTYLTIYPSTYLPIYLSTYLPIYLSTYLPY